MKMSKSHDEESIKYKIKIKILFSSGLSRRSNYYKKIIFLENKIEMLKN